MRFENLVFWPSLVLVLLAPLPFGSVLTWSWSLLGLCTAALIIVWCIGTYVTGTSPQVEIKSIWIPALMYGAAVAWSLIQVAPFAPGSWHHPIWSEAAGILETGIVGSVAVDAQEAGSALLRLLTFAGLFWLALQSCRNPRNAWLAIYTVAVAGLVYAVYGLMVQFSGIPMVLWFEKSSYTTDLTSTFINRNSYATYAGLGLLCVTALITDRFLHIHSAGRDFRQRIRIFLNEYFGRDWILFLSWIVLATALLLTHSRGGLISTLAGLAAFVLILMLSPNVPSRIARTLGALVLVAVLAAAVISGQRVFDRLADTTSEKAVYRKEIFRLTTNAIDDSPILGTGLGSFEQVFHLYRGDAAVFRVRSKRAHNSYLENAMELGIPAAASLTLAIASLSLLCVFGVWRRRRDVVLPAIGFAATVLVGVHSLVDFSLQIPAVAATFSFLLGLACAQSWSSR